MTYKNRFVILVKTDNGELLPSPSPYDNTWPTHAQAEQEAARRHPLPNGKYIVMETAPTLAPDRLGARNSKLWKHQPSALGEKRRPKVPRRHKGPRLRKF